MSGGTFREKNFLGQFLLLISFSKFRQIFSGPLATNLRSGYQKCIRGVQGKNREKKVFLEKLTFWKKLFRSLSEFLSKDLNTAFVVSRGARCGKNVLLEKLNRITSVLDCEQTTHSRFVKPVIYVSKAKIRRKVCCLEELLLYITFRYPVKNTRQWCQT